MSPMRKRRRRNKKIGEAIRAAGLVSMLTQAAMTFVVGSIGGFYVGRYFDGKLGTEPLLQLVFLFVGFGAGIYTTVWALTKYEKRIQAEKGEGKGNSTQGDA